MQCIALAGTATLLVVQIVRRRPGCFQRMEDADHRSAHLAVQRTGRAPSIGQSGRARGIALSSSSHLSAITVCLPDAW